MNILNSEKNHGSLKVTIQVSKEEFDEARLNAYRNCAENYPVPGKSATEADLSELKRLYGPAVLYDEALAELVPQAFGTYLNENGTRILGKPRAEDIEFLDDGSVQFTVEADCFPDIELGTYKGIHASASDPDEFREQVLAKACASMKTEIPEHLIEDKLDSMVASEKLRIAQDAIYHLLADTLYYLKKGYELAGISRPMNQVREQAMDIMLQMVSFDNSAPSPEYLIEQIGDEVGRYHELPDHFREDLQKTMRERSDAKASMKPEERIEEVWKAYLGSIQSDEELWRKDQREEAEKRVKKDLLFLKTAELEDLKLTEEEVRKGYQDLADRYGIEIDALLAQLPEEAMRQQLLRDAAEELILESAVHDQS